MPLGTCVGWKEDRCFGFIRPDEGGGDIFVHRKSLVGSALWLEQGQRVEFEIGLDARTGKHQALNVEILR
ncbi:MULTISPECIES: cold-shock protein [unclassified Bradyrhizobium]|uniref:cold-shock protein n=1 Tax=unclassified Bradyrhizobium TaxID=2631580 RepID=UPI0020B2CB1F|nr:MULTISPECIES: cold shock domain-containing protein [unclassified Bradyrhizobium]MCP3397121.1 cold shock domain-containing protein [Bradyrhizobium sp. CCGB20]MCP3405634.1 cold shock domain-containing protein [Bradyrhizobium sp. CCGB01]